MCPAVGGAVYTDDMGIVPYGEQGVRRITVHFSTCHSETVTDVTVVGIRNTPYAEDEERIATPVPNDRFLMAA